MRFSHWILFATVIFAFVLPTELWGQGQGQGQGRGRGRGHAGQEASVRSERDNSDHDSNDDGTRGRTVVRIDDLDDLDDFDDDEVLVLRDTRGRRIIVDRRDIERRFSVTSEHRRGPAFCRSGAGHPVWGREWCLERGYGLGTQRIVLDRGRVYFPLGNDILVARAVVRDDRSWVERTIDRVLFWAD
jgi:hypothetical protein